MSNIRAIKNNIVVKRDEVITETENGILIPDSGRDKDKPQIGIVVKVGPDLNNTIKEGEKLYFAKYSGAEVSIGGEDYLVIKESDVLVVFD